MKNHLLLIPALALCINASAQNAGGRISGIVVDEAEDTPLTGASIVVKELQKGQVADINGKFTFTNLPEATYTVLVDLIGYDPQEKTVRVEKGRTTSLLICMKEQPLSLEQATVTAKSEARKVREQAMPVSVISMKQLQGTVSDIQGILAKTVGVTVRSTGGVGSASRLSVRGLEGKRIGFFIDEAPMNDQSDFLDLNDIPVDMIFTNEKNELYVACTGYFGYNPMHLANGFAVIDTATNEFVPEKSWDISGTPIEGSEYKSASIYNCQYLGGGKAVAYVGIIELMGDNPYTARNSMAVSIDLDKRTVKKIEGVPYSDGHSVAIEYHDGVVYFSSFGVDKAGIFAYDPATGTVTQPVSLNGNVNYIHFFE